MKRTVSLLLLLVLCLAMLPARRALAYYPEDPEAVDWIDTVTLTLPAPQKGGVSVEYTPDWPEDTNYLVSDDDVKWYDVTDPTAAVLLTKKGVFAVGHVYRVEMLVRHWGGCAFENSVAVTLNGAVPDYVALDPDTGHMTVKHTFPAVIEPEVVATVAFTITPPVAGAKPSYAATLPANAHYHLDPQSVDYMENNVFWEEVGKTIVDETGAHEETEPMEPGKDTFQTGKTYRVYIIRFVPDEDYVFSDGLIATINGKAAMVTRDGDDGAYVAYYTFPALSSKPVITVQPQDVTVNEGQTANFSVTATGGELTYAWQYLKPGETTWRNVSKNGTPPIPW